MLRSNLISNTYTAYFYPVNGASNSPTFTTNPGSQGQIFRTQCKKIIGTNRDSCSINLDMSTAPGGPYLFHVVSIYDQSDISIQADGGSTKFKNSQAVIDATGKAQDVLRRIQVVYPLQNHVSLPSDALEATDICKRMQSNTTNTTYPDSAIDASCDY